MQRTLVNKKDSVITHVSPQSTPRPQRDVKQAFSVHFARPGVSEVRFTPWG